MKHLLLLLSALATSTACTGSDPCAGGADDTVCARTVDAGQTIDAAPTFDALWADFGTTCTDNTTHAECGGPTDYCAIQPGQTEGYCTATGCDTDPSVCPDDWTCFDLSQFDPSLPHLCLQP